MNLQLSLKTKWFEMTKAGIKTEDYREINPYWIARLTTIGEYTIKQNLVSSLEYHLKTDFLKNGIFKIFDINTMTLGYPKKDDTERTIKFEHAGIEIRTGNQEWGSEPNKLYFVIKHGKRLKQKEDKK